MTRISLQIGHMYFIKLVLQSTLLVTETLLTMVGECDMNKLVSKSGYRTYIYLIPNVVVIIMKHHFQEINPTNSTNDNVMSSF